MNIHKTFKNLTTLLILSTGFFLSPIYSFHTSLSNFKIEVSSSAYAQRGRRIGKAMGVVLGWVAESVISSTLLDKSLEESRVNFCGINS